MSIALQPSAFRRFVERKGRDWLFEVGIAAIVSLLVIGLIAAWLLMPIAIENHERLQEQFRQNRVEAVQEYEADGQRERESGVSAGVHRAASPEQAGSTSVP